MTHCARDSDANFVIPAGPSGDSWASYFRLEPFSIPSTFERNVFEYDRVNSHIFYERVFVTDYDKPLGDVRRELVKAGREAHKTCFENRTAPLAIHDEPYAEPIGHDLYLL